MTLLLALLLGQLDAGTTVSAPRATSPGTSVLRASELIAPERDPARAFQQAPGVARAALGSSGVVLWGAAPGESRFFVDELEVPTLLHQGGYHSVLAAPLIGRLEVSPGAFRADVGRALGGLVRVGLAELQPGGHAGASVDLTNASAFASLGSEHVRASLSGDVSLLRPVVEPFLQGLARDRYALPTAFDVQGRLSLTPGEVDAVEVLALASSDASDEQVASVDPSLSRGQRSSQWYARLGTTWRHGASDDGFTLTPFVGVDRQARELSGAVGLASSSEQRWSTGLRARSIGNPTPWLALQYGVDALLVRGDFARSGPPTFPPREGDVSTFGEPISSQVAVDGWHTTAIDAAAWAAVDLQVGPVSIAPGVRLGVVSSDVSRASPRVAGTPPLGLSSLEFVLEPRGRVSWAATPALTLAVAGGLTHQAPDGVDQSAVFGTPTLLVARGAQAAVEASLSSGLLTLEATGYWRGSQGLAVRDASALPGVTSALLSTGEGRAFGAQVHVRQRAWHGLSSSLGWTVGRSERRDSGASAWRLSDFDQTHTVVASAAWQPGPWRFGVRGRFATGAPRTPVVGAYVDLRLGVTDPVFGAANSVRLPDFLQLDLDAAYTFTLPRGALELFLSVLNVTNRRNVEEFVYDSTFSTRGALLGLPLFATLGLRGDW